MICRETNREPQIIEANALPIEQFPRPIGFTCYKNISRVAIQSIFYLVTFESKLVPEILFLLTTALFSGQLFVLCVVTFVFSPQLYVTVFRLGRDCSGLDGPPDHPGSHGSRPPRILECGVLQQLRFRK